MGRYIPDTAKQQEVMLKQIGLNKIDDLYSMVPEEVRLKELDIPDSVRRGDGHILAVLL